jgi:hypothetical protein
MPSDVIVMAREEQLKVAMDPGLAYAPTVFRGTIHWINLTPPTPGDPRQTWREMLSRREASAVEATDLAMWSDVAREDEAAFSQTLAENWPAE